MKKIIIKSILLSLLATNSMAMGSGFYAGVGVGVQDVFSELSLTDYDENGVDVAL